jgi:uncharacterized protein (DUF1786 family)
MILPSPTMIVRREIQLATQRGDAVLLTGVMMGGGPCQWAAEAHLRSGLRLFATPDAGRTFNDDLDWVSREMGVQIVSADEAARMDDVRRIALRDFDLPAIRQVFDSFGVAFAPAALGVAVFDHGAAPPAVSDRQFRFDYLAERIRAHNRLTAFAYLAEDVPPAMTRMLAVVHSAGGLDCPLVVMDTAPAAILGALEDPLVAAPARKLIVNLGNFHTLAFRLGPAVIEGVLEHHTGLLELPGLEVLLTRLASGTLTHDEVFDGHGHGALLVDRSPLSLDSGSFGVAVTGPRRAMMATSGLRPYFAVPHGDMMLAGCFGVLRALAELVPALGDPLRAALLGAGRTAPWDPPAD